MDFVYVSLLLISLNGILHLNGQILSGQAQLNYFELYGRCCPTSPNYDPNVPLSPSIPDGPCHVNNDW